MENVKRITIAKGDGIEPEIMNATFKVLNALFRTARYRFDCL